MTPDSAIRTVEGGPLEALVTGDVDGGVLRYLDAHQPSCHSDTGEALLQSAAKCGDWLAYSPSFRSLRYVALITAGKIFALGLGQRAICYRLPETLRTVALRTGADAATEIGAEWVRFELFRPDWPAPDLPFWTLRAYAAAREQFQEPA